MNGLKEIEQQHKTDNGLLRQELDMQIEHNKELDSILYAKQSMIDELTQNEEQLKIELGEEKLISEYWQDRFLEQVKYGNKITVSGDPVIIKNVIDTVTYNYIPKDKIKEKIEELEKEQKEYKNNQEWEIQDDIVAQINILKDLLEGK